MQTSCINFARLPASETPLASAVEVGWFALLWILNWRRFNPRRLEAETHRRSSSLRSASTCCIHFRRHPGIQDKTAPRGTAVAAKATGITLPLSAEDAPSAAASSVLVSTASVREQPNWISPASLTTAATSSSTAPTLRSAAAPRPTSRRRLTNQSRRTMGIASHTYGLGASLGNEVLEAAIGDYNGNGLGFATFGFSSTNSWSASGSSSRCRRLSKSERTNEHNGFFDSGERSDARIGEALTNWGTGMRITAPPQSLRAGARSANRLAAWRRADGATCSTGATNWKR